MTARSPKSLSVLARPDDESDHAGVKQPAQPAAPGAPPRRADSREPLIGTPTALNPAQANELSTPSLRRRQPGPSSGNVKPDPASTGCRTLSTTATIEIHSAAIPVDTNGPVEAGAGNPLGRVVVDVPSGVAAHAPRGPQTPPGVRVVEASALPCRARRLGCHRGSNPTGYQKRQ